MRLFGVDIFNNDKGKKPIAQTFPSTVLDADSLNLPKGYGGVNQLTIPFHFYGNDSDKIEIYRKIANTVHVNLAITEIKNESFVFNEPKKKAFHIDFYDDDDINNSIRDKIVDEVENLYRITRFNDIGIEWFEKFYVDGRFILQTVVDDVKKGIIDVVELDPSKVRKVKFIPEPDSNGVIDINDIEEAYLYSNTHSKNVDMSQTLYMTHSQYDTDTQIVIKSDSVVMTTSGIKDMNSGKTIGYLDKAIVPYNNLKMMEESMIIFRVARAPMRRAFYVDVGNLQPNRAEAYMKEMKDRFKIKVTYDSNTGTFSGDRHIHSMLEDYWLPRQSNKTTEIQTLDGGSDQSILDEVEYYKSQLWLSLNVPQSRFQEQASYIFGKGVEIQRDEYRFNKFIQILRNRFMVIFDELLKRQLILKGIIKEYEWEEIRDSYFWVYTEDNLYAEYKNAEKINNIMDMLDRIQPHTGTYFSREWVRKNICKFTDDEIKEIQAQNDAEPIEEEE